jgi:putative ABC transport system permease protein
MIRRLAWHQLIAERRRLAAAVAGITFAVLLELMQFGFYDALFTSATLLHSRLDADLVLASANYEYVLSPGAFPRRRLQQALMLDDVESVAPVNVALAPFRNTETGEDRLIVVIGFDPREEVFDVASIRRNLDPVHVPDVAIFDALSRPEFGPVARQLRTDGVVRTEVAGRRLEVAGLFELGVSFAGNGHVITSDVTFRRLFPNLHEGTVHLGLVRLRPGSDARAAQAMLTAELPSDVRVLRRDELVAVEHSYWARNTPIGFVFALGTFVCLLVGAVIVYQILYTDVSSHLSEYATLKAIGYTDRALQGVVLRQALILAVLGFPVGFLFAHGINIYARQQTNLPIFLTPGRVMIVFVLTLVMCGVAAVLAMRKVQSADPADVF